MSERQPTPERATGAPRGKRPYRRPRLTEYGSVAKLTQGSRSVQADFCGATTFKKASCL